MFSVKSYTLSGVLETRMVANKYRSPLGRQPACGARKKKKRRRVRATRFPVDKWHEAANKNSPAT